MSSFETPFLRQWNAHQQLSFGQSSSSQSRSSSSSNATSPAFPYYKGHPLLLESGDEAEEDQDGNTYLPRALPHPWTFGAVWQFVGLHEGELERVKRELREKKESEEKLITWNKGKAGVTKEDPWA